MLVLGRPRKGRLYELKPGATFSGGKLNNYTILAPTADTGPSVVLGPPTVFDKSNVEKFNFLT